jgi:hypothetical protein
MKRVLVALSLIFVLEPVVAVLAGIWLLHLMRSDKMNQQKYG